MTAQIVPASGVASVDPLISAGVGGRYKLREFLFDTEGVAPLRSPGVGGAARGAPADYPVIPVADFRTILAPNTPAGVVKDRNALRRCLITHARMLACWGPECFPSAPGSQIHFARALMESAAQEMAEAAGAPYPVPDTDPANNPIAGAIALLARIEHTLTSLNGVHTLDTEKPGTIVLGQVDVAVDLVDIGALLSALRIMRV